MTYECFEDVPVRRASMDLGVEVYRLTSTPVFQSNRSLRDQIERAAVSVANNIAEGFERGTTQELLSFLYIVRGSAAEVWSMLCFLERLAEDAEDDKTNGLHVDYRNWGHRLSGLVDLKSQELVDLKSQISNLKSLAESISRQLRGWANSLPNSDIPGQRRLNTRRPALSEPSVSARSSWSGCVRLRKVGMRRGSGGFSPPSVVAITGDMAEGKVMMPGASVQAPAGVGITGDMAG